jgi:xylan 1,4-beta-xylosidase
VFWTGGQAGYFHLFNVTSRAIKAVDSRLRVGGPATAMSAWIPDFLNYTRTNAVPFDFISTHEYPTDPPGPQTRTFFRDRLALTRGVVGPDLPLYYTEYDDAYNDDTAYSAAFIVFQNRAVSGIVDLLSFWPFSDLFEEGGLYPVPFDRAGLAVDGLVNVYGIPKPSYRAFQLLAWSGEELLDSQPDFLAHPTVGLFAVGGNGTSVFITNWNMKGQPIDDYNVTVTVSGLPGAASRTCATLYRIDDSNGNAYPAWQAMGGPQYLSPQQVQALTSASAMTPASVPLTVLAADTVQFTAFVAGNTVVNVILA